MIVILSFTSVFKGIYLGIILPDTQKLARPVDRKTAVVSFTKTLTDSQAFVDRYPKGWNLTTQKLIELLVNPPTVNKNDDVIVDADVDELGFGVGQVQEGLAALLGLHRPHRGRGEVVESCDELSGERVHRVGAAGGLAHDLILPPKGRH